LSQKAGACGEFRVYFFFRLGFDELNCFFDGGIGGGGACGGSEDFNFAEVEV
jgi:hypothetical protein